MSASELINRLRRLLYSGNASTFCINGPPGSGKSYLLQILKERLPSEIPQTLVLGVYPLAWEEVDSLGKHALQDLYNAGFTENIPPLCEELSLTGAWRWFGENAHLPPRQTFVILVDLEKTDSFNLPTMGRLFSDARHLEEVWRRSAVRLLHVFTGCWDSPNLERYFQDINTSFPYTVGQNYAVWNGLSQEEMTEMVVQGPFMGITPLHGHLLFELTGGHPAAALDILHNLNPEPPALLAILAATRHAAASGPAGRALLEVWCSLPSRALNILADLLLRQRVLAEGLSSDLERLLAAGAVRLERVGDSNYVGFRSWYVELLVRCHANELGIADKIGQGIPIDELVPKITALNMEAFCLINTVETLVRNFVVTELWMRKSQGENLLAGRAKRFNKDTQNCEDAHQQAVEWRTRSKKQKMPVELNPLIAYLSTRSLADLVDELGREISSEEWQQIAQAIRDLAGVRDAVMHNQLVDEVSLQRLYGLQARIYRMLSATPEH